jgi:hypothetical protein
MKKKTLKINILLVFLFLLCSSCVKKVENCKFLPKIEIESQKNNESHEKTADSKEKVKNMIDNRTTSAQISCKF